MLKIIRTLGSVSETLPINRRRGGRQWEVTLALTHPMVLALVLMTLIAGGEAHAQPAAGPVKIVAAENFYGDVAQQLGGPQVTVTSILSNPDQDPHLFEASPSVARQLSAADIVVYNGASYDPWMEKLLGAASSPKRREISVGEIVHAKAGQNPHLWYNPATMSAFAQALSQSLTTIDPAHKADYDQRLQSFLDQTKAIDTRVADLKRKYAGTPVTATEPVFGYMADALGLEMHNERFQTAVMNDSEPSASDVAAFESDLRQKRAKLFIYNSQATDGAARRLLHLAEQNKIPVLPVTETEPKGKNYQQWMLGELDALDRALDHTPASRGP